MDEAGCIETTRSFHLLGLVAGIVAALSLVVAGSASARAAAAPANTSAPTISGTAQQGQTLTASTGTWSGSAPIQFAYQWQSCDGHGGGCANLNGSTSATYAVQKQDVNQTLRVVVTATNNEGASTAISAVTVPVTAAPAPPPAPKPTPAPKAAAPVNTATPTISGTATAGQTLTASTGSWSGNQPITYTYAWQRCDSASHCNPIGGANNATYQLAAADVGKTIRVVVTAKNAGGSTSAPSALTGAVAGAPAPVVSISISASTFRALFGTAITLSGTISTTQGGQSVTIEGQQYGQGQATALATVTTAADGSWSFRTKPGIQTAYKATWNGATSNGLTVGVMPLVSFHLVTHKRFSTRVVAARSFAGRLVQFQRLDPSGHWVTMKRIRLGANSGAVFAAKLATASSLRMALSVNQAGAGYLGSLSRTIALPLPAI